MASTNHSSAVKRNFEDYITRFEPLLCELAVGKAPDSFEGTAKEWADEYHATHRPDWYDGTVNEWVYEAGLAHVYLKGKAHAFFLAQMADAAHAAATEAAGLAAATVGVTPALVGEAGRLLAALRQRPDVLRAFDHSGRLHALVELSTGALLGPPTRAMGLCKEAAEALGELTELAPAVQSGPLSAGPSLVSLAKEAKQLRHVMRHADYKAVGVQMDSNAQAVKRDLLDIEWGRENGPLANKVLLIDLSRKVLELKRERPIPAEAKA